MAIFRTRTRAGVVTQAAVAIGLSVAAVPSPGAASSASTATPTQLYVAPWGKDLWPGTLDRPFATPARAQQAVRARAPRMTSDLVVNLRGGTYHLKAPLRLSEAAGDSGRGGHRVIYQAYGHGTPRQERVTISGGRQISGWRPDGRLRGFWRADVGGLDTRQLYVGDRRATRLTRDGTGFSGTGDGRLGGVVARDGRARRPEAAFGSGGAGAGCAVSGSAAAQRRAGDGEDGEEDECGGRAEYGPGCQFRVGLVLRQQAAPLRGGRLFAQAEEAEGSQNEDRGGQP